MSPYLVVFCLSGLIFAAMLTVDARRRRRVVAVEPARTNEIVVAGLTSINLGGVIGLGWFAANMLSNDGLMVVELAICAALIATLAVVTAGGFALARRGKTIAAIAVLAIGALPTLAAYGFLLYLDNNPIDWR